MKQEIYDLRETINNTNPLVRLFFKWKFNKCIRMAKLEKDDIILDFGCGGKYLKKVLPEHNVISYDYDSKFELKMHEFYNSGIELQWASRSDKEYNIYRSTNLMNGWVLLKTNLPGNTSYVYFHDYTATNDCPYFYTCPGYIT